MEGHEIFYEHLKKCHNKNVKFSCGLLSTDDNTPHLNSVNKNLHVRICDVAETSFLLLAWHSILKNAEEFQKRI